MEPDAWDEHEERRLGRRIIGDIFIGGGRADDEDDEEPFDEGDLPDDGEGPFDGSPEEDFTDDDDVDIQTVEIERSGPVGACAREWVNTDIDTDRMMADLFKPGTNHVTDGLRGGGKTFQAVGYSEAMVEGAFKGMPRTIMLTNIIFVKRVALDGDLEDQFVMETPPNVYHVTSMEEMFRLEARLMKRYGREGVMFLVVLDEAQNFLLADEYQQETSIAFVKWYGTTRKFNTCLWLLTPSINNLPPRARNFLDGDPAGYVNARWRKNKHLASQYIRQHNIAGADPREFTQLKLGTDMPPVWFRVTTTPWTRPLEELAVGEYGYDHLANADFKVSIDKDRPFDFDGFLECCSDMPSYKMATVMEEFFQRMDGVSGGAVPDPKRDERNEKAAMIHRMRGIGLKWSEIEDILQIPTSTCQTWYAKYRRENGLDDPSGNAKAKSPAVPKGRHGRRTELFPKRVFPDPGNATETAGKQGENHGSEGSVTSVFQSPARPKNDDGSTTLFRAPYVYNPTEGGNEEGSTVFSGNDPQPVDGRLTPAEGASGPSEDPVTEPSDDDKGGVFADDDEWEDFAEDEGEEGPGMDDAGNGDE